MNRGVPPLKAPYYIELFGDNRDGRVIEVSAAIMRAQKLCIAGTDCPDCLECRKDDPLTAVHTETWTWDGTVTPAGHYRFRRAR